jgi:uncharacterized protein YybS (DUF2232 family)
LVTFIPVAALVAMILLPIPFIVYTSRYGSKYGALMLAVTSLLTMIFFTFVSLPLTLLMGIGGILIGHAIYKKRTAYETLAFGTLGFIGGLLFTVVFFQLLFGVNFMQEFETAANEQVGWYTSFIEGLGVETDPDMDLEAVLKDQIQLFMNLIPAFLALTAVGLAFLSQWISYKIINRIDKKAYRFPPFRELKLPASIIWLYLIVIIASFFDLDPNGMMFIAVQNALIVLEMVLVIQGFSFIFYFAHHKKWSRAVPIISIVLTFLFPIFLLYFVRILGIIDIGLNLRDRLEKNK